MECFDPYFFITCFMASEEVKLKNPAALQLPQCSATSDKTDSETTTSVEVQNPIKHEALANSIRSFTVRKILLEGRFGCLLLGNHMPTGQIVSMTVYSKRALTEMCQQHIVNREKLILENLEHPFIPRLLCALSDSSCLYIVSDYQLGGQLSSLLNNRNVNLSDQAKVFYAACIVSVVKYCHQKNIVHRGIHPDSVLIDGDGYVKLTDWGFAKCVREPTYTLCGHVDYLCPEAISLDSGYGKGADYWALGVFIYEMLVGYSPFVGSNENLSESIIIENILTQTPSFPSSLSLSAKSIIISLLHKNPIYRLGCRKGSACEEVQKHIYFTGINWNQLIKREHNSPPPPWIPDRESLIDTRHYASSGCVREVNSMAEFQALYKDWSYDGYNHLEWNSFSS